MFQNANFPGPAPDPAEGAYSAPSDLLADGEGVRWSPPKNPTPALGLLGSGGSTLGPGGTGPPTLAQAPQIFGHSSSATGWINWFYSNFA